MSVATIPFTSPMNRNVMCIWSGSDHLAPGTPLQMAVRRSLMAEGKGIAVKYRIHANRTQDNVPRLVMAAG